MGLVHNALKITRWVSIILHTASGYIIKYSNGVSPPSPCQPRTPEPQFLLLPDDIFLFILTAFMTRGAGPVGGGCGLKGRVLTVLTVIIPQMNSNSYRSYLQGSHVAWIMLLRFTMLTRDLRNVIKMWRIPVPDCLCPDKAACQMFRWYDVRNVSHGSDTVSSVANLGLTFAEYSHSRWWAEFVGFAEDYFPLGDYLTLNLRPAKWPATPHVYLRDKWQRGRVSSLQAPGSWQPGDFDDVCLSVLTTDWQWSTDDIWYIVLVIYLILRRGCVFVYT